MIKKVTLNMYTEDGTFEYKSTMTFRKGIVAPNYEEAKKTIQKSVNKQKTLDNRRYIVEWVRNGDIEGYMNIQK